MKTTIQGYLVIALIAVAFFGCKKTKLNGDYAALRGTWDYQNGYNDNGSQLYKLDLKERGKYTLYLGNTKCEYGRLLSDGKYLRFKSDNVIKKIEQKPLFLSGRFILNFTPSVLVIA